MEAVKRNHMNSCLERLHRLENILSGISNKPNQIPLEKEQMLLESWDRIKGLEVDLTKTKKVLETTLVQQLRLAESLESSQESPAQMRLFCG